MTSKILLFLLILLSALEVKSQRGFVDDFDDGSLTIPARNAGESPTVIWSTLSPRTYGLSESNGVLEIDYQKIGGTGAFDCFTLTPPYSVNVSGNPHLQLRLRSSINTVLTIRSVYSLKPPTYEEKSLQISGDLQWHTYTFSLYDYLYDRFAVQYVEFYLDQGVNKTIKGTIELDVVRLGWNYIKIDSLSAKNAAENTMILSWQCSDSARTQAYQIHRSTEVRFIPDETTVRGESLITVFTDTGLADYGSYYYKIIPIDTLGEMSLPSPELRAESFVPDAVPQVNVTQVNNHVVKKYEKLEMTLALENVGIENPYNPDDIDVFADFRSPLGETIRINGFYDDYRNADAWKIRFAPHQTGRWSYVVTVNDAGRIGSTNQQDFVVSESNHHGWMRPSKKNRHYFSFDDETSYYPVGVYSPWGNDASRFERFAEHQANLFAIWDIGYGGFINETGIIEEELGKYNQEKLGRIDSLLSVLEKDDIQLMYAIWPHDLFSETVWASEWDKNPYRQLTDVVDVYRDSLAWEYQIRKYRYLIARFGHSRSMGIWELINEMNGTDGWKEARFQSAYDWVARTDKYFEENDPYNHPVTASFSGGFNEYRKELYELNDIPNLHVYPAQGWALRYPQDTMRSDMYNYAWASRRFWQNFTKPAIFGEAGADLSYFHRNDPRYHEAYHNAIWASLSNGLA
ncbi:MAG: DUF5060 domain-containing protein, partial [Saprospiraceae bacterium]|nr:DUF5060 domain-containing protein [Saprospiraceae bacterium]